VTGYGSVAARSVPGSGGWRQVLTRFAGAGLPRKAETYAHPACGFGVGTATVYR
jgi:hypothetical protein